MPADVEERNEQVSPTDSVRCQITRELAIEAAGWSSAAVAIIQGTNPSSSVPERVAERVVEIAVQMARTSRIVAGS